MKRILLAALSSLSLLACSSAPWEPSFVSTRSGLVYEVVSEGSGARAEPGQYVLIHETLRLQAGEVVFTTEGGEPLRFLLGGNQVIAGLDEGVTGMREGEWRRIIVPPHLATRTIYPDGISPDDTLIYEVVLEEIED